MFERVIEAAEGRVRASAALAPAFRGSEAAFWTAVAANLRRAETDAGRPKCRSAGKTTYRSESVARVAAQHGAEQDHGSRVWNAYPCAACAGWHVGHGWSTRVSDARPLTDGYEYGERLDVTFAVSGESAIDGRCYRDQLRAALRRHVEDYSFDVEGDYTSRCLWPRGLRLRVAPEDADRVLSLRGVRVGEATLRLERPAIQELRPAARLFCRVATVKGALEPEQLGASLAERIAAWGGSATVAVGDRKVLAVAGATIVGFEVELRDLDGRSSMIVQAEGLGGRGRYGCGIFLRDPE